MPNWKKVVVSGSDAALNSLYAPSITGSLQGTASYATNALSASYALNGGVTQLLAGPNVTISPTNGLGQVTVSATLSGSAVFNTSTGSYGSFYDTTTQTNPVGNTPRSMSFNSTDITNGVSISGSTSPFNTYIKTTNAGVYDIQFSAQVEKTDSGTDEIVIWLRKNGIDLTDSATKLTLSGNSTKVVAAWNWFVSSAANDYYQIIWVSADTGMRLYAEPINSTPGIPSVIVTANRVDQFLSNTGSFSGSFTGSLLGTASFATSASFALTASYVQTAQTSSYVLNAVSSSYALTASYVANASSFPYTGSALITGSLGVTGSLTATQIGAGAVPSGSVRLDVRASSSAATDTVFRVRNSADTANLIEIAGNNTMTFLSTAGKAIFSSSGSGANLSMRRDFSNEEMIKINAGDFPFIEVKPINTTSHIAVGTLANGASTWWDGVNYNFQIKNSFHNLFHVVGNTNSALATFRLGTIASNTNFFNIHGRNAGGTGLTTDPVFTINSAGNFGNGAISFGTNAQFVFAQLNGVAPTTSPTDIYQQYSADRNGVAGKASPHFRTEDGTVVWLGDESRLFNVTASRTIISSSQNTISGSSLTVYGSGSAQPVFTVQGSQGELFSVTDSLSGSLFSVNDISGLPILEVFSDNTTLIGNYLDPMLITTAKVTQTNSGSFVMYSLPTASYDTAFFEYSVRSGSNARAGTIMAIQSGSAVNFTETTTTDFGSTSAISFVVVVTGSNMALTGSSTTGSWTIKTIVRGL